MGSDNQDSSSQANEQPQHEVHVDGFWIMRTEVTNAQYMNCVNTQACIPPTNERYKNPQFAKHPVTDITWEQAGAYARWVGGRLPSEAEWEKACRGEDTRLYPWGNETPAPDQLNFSVSGLFTWVNVGSYAPGVYGLYDMAGNVWEWTNSKYQNYPYQSGDGREDPQGGGGRVLRGGSFGFSGTDVRCALRAERDPTEIGYNIGFRVVISITPLRASPVYSSRAAR
jgi:formylglycine-generating enzyme required for sulfatase activity